MMITYSLPKYSPWGKIQDTKVISDGISFVSTASHGGFKLSRELNAQIPKCFRKEGGWYEEDCEYSIVIMFFPEFFKEKDIDIAMNTVKNWFPDSYEQYTGTTLLPEESYQKSRDIFHESNKNKWVAIAASGKPNDMVEVYATIGGGRGMNDHGRTFLVSDAEYKNRNPFGFVIDLDRHQEVNN